MPDCDSLKTCPFFLGTLPKVPAAADCLRGSYCRRNYMACARCMGRRSQGKEHVPTDLFPDDVGRAYRMIAGAPPSPPAA